MTEHVYALEGLCCPNCAAKISQACQKLPGVRDAQASAMTERLHISTETPHDIDALTDQVKRIVARTEPDVRVSRLSATVAATVGATVGVAVGAPAAPAPGRTTGISSSSTGVSGSTTGVRGNTGSAKPRSDVRIDTILGAHGTPQASQVREKPDAQTHTQSPPHAHTQNPERLSLSSPKILVARLILAAALLIAGHFLSGLPAAVALIAGWLIAGVDVLFRAARNLFVGHMLDENLLMSVATVGAIALGDLPEAVFVMLFYQVGEGFQELAVRRSRRSISALMDNRPDEARLLESDAERVVPAQSVVVGARVRVLPYESVPLDGVIERGASSVVTAALTGESAPRDMAAGDEVLAGYVNGGGALEIRVTRAYGESTVSRILTMVQESQARKAPTEQFITRFARIYTPVVVLAAALLAVIPSLITGAWGEWVYRAMTFLVISCPCALVLSVPLGYFAGIGAASRRGVLIKGGQYMEALCDVDRVAFDKTGTLTKAEFSVAQVEPAPGVSRAELTQAAALAESWSQHPIALSICKAFAPDSASGKNAPAALTSYEEIPGYGVKAETPQGVIHAGNARLMARIGLEAGNAQLPGAVVHVARENRYLGYILVSDTVKDDAKAAISGLRRMGVKRMVLLSGDTEVTARHVSAELGLDGFHAGLLPGDKVARLEALAGSAVSKRGKLAFVGDGVNDAPVLARADVGVAMGGLGSDAAIEAADVVLMTDQPSRLVDAMRISRRTRRIVMQNIVLALAVKLVVLGLGALGYASMWQAVFADVGVALIAVMNALRALRA